MKEGVGGLVIWLDGAYGVGKSTIASELKNRCKDSIVLESDVLCNEVLKKIVEETVNGELPNLGGLLPQNNKKFLQFFLQKITDEATKHSVVIVDMALTQPESRDYLYEPAAETLKNSVHIILGAGEEEMRQRIKNDTDRQKDVALDYLKENTAFLKNNYSDAYRIDTSCKNVEDIAEEILGIINDKL